jgi:hypothetical protein
MGDEEPKTKAKMNQYKLLLNSCIPKEKLRVKQSPVKYRKGMLINRRAFLLWSNLFHFVL